MRIYPNQDVSFYIEKLDWQRCCRNPYKSWKPYKSHDPVRFINYWRDLEGVKKDVIKKSDLYFDKWMVSRINERVCLPLYYAIGNRFIKLLKKPPAGFKCADVPLNLAEARVVKAQIAAEKKQQKGKKGKGKGKGKKK